MSDLTNAREALKHRWSEPRVTGYGFAWACPDCDSVVQGMPPDRDALCKGRMLAEIERLGSAHDTLRAQLTTADALIARLTGESAEMADALNRLLTAYRGGYFVDDDGVPLHRDHACLACWPDNEVRDPDWRCPYHTAMRLSALLSATRAGQ